MDRGPVPAPSRRCWLCRDALPQGAALELAACGTTAAGSRVTLESGDSGQGRYRSLLAWVMEDLHRYLNLNPEEGEMVGWAGDGWSDG